MAGHIYLELDELVAVGVSQQSIYSARKRGTRGYTFLQDPEDRRRLLVRYDGLKHQVRVLVDQVYGEALADQRRLWVLDLRPASADLAVLREHVLPDGTRLPEPTVQRYAMACAYLSLLDRATRAQVAEWGYENTRAWQQDVVKTAKEKKIPLPAAYSRLMAKVREYRTNGASALISQRWGNQNSRKIGAEQSAWLVAQYAQPTKPDHARVAMGYAVVAKAKGWPSLTESAVYRHLMQPDVQPLWTMGRHGTTHWRNRYAHSMSLRAPSHRDALWCSDGTKLNYFYQGEKGMTAKLQVYLIMDVYSEAILGHSFGASENFRMQFAAAKMALKRSGARPLQWLYDNQGGHKKAESQDFYSRAASLHFPAQPYNSKAKPIESVIGRMQQQVMRERWFFTGQNITAKRLDSRPNLDFIEANRHKLPTLDEVMHAAAQDVEKWNAQPHPKSGVARIQMYEASTNPQSQPLGFMDMVELFWQTSQRPITYRNTGLQLEVSSQRVLYEVCDASGSPNKNFLRRWTNARFLVKYDPEDLSVVFLYREENGELRYVASASVKRTYARAASDLQPGERGDIDGLLALRKQQEADTRRELEELRRLSEVDPETLVTLGYRGDKDEMNRAESDLQAGAHHHEEDDREIDLISRL